MIFKEVEEYANNYGIWFGDEGVRDRLSSTLKNITLEPVSKEWWLDWCKNGQRRQDRFAAFSPSFTLDKKYFKADGPSVGGGSYAGYIQYFPLNHRFVLEQHRYHGMGANPTFVLEPIYTPEEVLKDWAYRYTFQNLYRDESLLPLRDRKPCDISIKEALAVATRVRAFIEYVCTSFNSTLKTPRDRNLLIRPSVMMDAYPGVFSTKYEDWIQKPQPAAYPDLA